MEHSGAQVGSFSLQADLYKVCELPGNAKYFGYRVPKGACDEVFRNVPLLD